MVAAHQLDPLRGRSPVDTWKSQVHPLLGFSWMFKLWPLSSCYEPPPAPYQAAKISLFGAASVWRRLWLENKSRNNSHTHTRGHGPESQTDANGRRRLRSSRLEEAHQVQGQVVDRHDLRQLHGEPSRQQQRQVGDHGVLLIVLTRKPAANAFATVGAFAVVWRSGRGCAFAQGSNPQSEPQGSTKGVKRLEESKQRKTRICLNPGQMKICPIVTEHLQKTTGENRQYFTQDRRT